MNRVLRFVNLIDGRVKKGEDESAVVTSVLANMEKLKYSLQLRDWTVTSYRQRLENRAKKAAGQGAPSGECQICGRRHKLVRVLGGRVTHLAHHGYERPGDGWQTASCRGARHLPFEVSRDLIPIVIADIDAWIGIQKKARAALDASPPETLYYPSGRRTVGRGVAPELVAVPKPESWVGPDMAAQRVYRSYDFLLSVKKTALEKRIASAAADVVALRKRHAGWKPKVTS